LYERLGGRTLAAAVSNLVFGEREDAMIKRLFGLAICGVIGLGTIAVAVPTPRTNACLYCVPIECPPCYALTGGSCFRCPSCQKIPGCKA